MYNALRPLVTLNFLTLNLLNDDSDRTITNAVTDRRCQTRSNPQQKPG